MLGFKDIQYATMRPLWVKSNQDIFPNVESLSRIFCKLEPLLINLKSRVLRYYHGDLTLNLLPPLKMPRIAFFDVWGYKSACDTLVSEAYRICGTELGHSPIGGSTDSLTLDQVVHSHEHHFKYGALGAH
jgi:hypothetical protein